MARASTRSRGSSPRRAASREEPKVHVIRKGVRCDTESAGHSAPRALSPLEIVVHASEGFIPLWEKGTILRWKFRDGSFEALADPDAMKASVTRLLGEAMLAWGDAAPVKFAQQDDVWDFEIVMRSADDCNISGCVLASAFFPDAGRHQLVVYPKMFEQTAEEQVETLIHEIGHIFGLRHFFAKVSETAWPSEIFGTHHKFSIMNYGKDSKLTKADRADLKKLYRSAWSGQLSDINGTPIQFVRPYHSAGGPTAMVVPVAAVKPAF